MSGDADPPEPRSVSAKRYAALILGLFAAVAFVPACSAAMLSPMMFDAPGSEQSGYTRLLFSMVAVAPAVAAGTAFLGLSTFRSYSRWRFRLAFVLPTGWIAAVVAAGYLLATRCGGSFTCA